MADGSDVTDCFGLNGLGCSLAEAYITRPSGSIDAVPPGGWVVIGNPAGDMATNITISLLDVSGNVVDAVKFGGDAPSLNATNANDEAVARRPDGLNTGNPSQDFFHAIGTPGTMASYAVKNLFPDRDGL
jgi:hypothetical protein